MALRVVLCLKTGGLLLLLYYRRVNRERTECRNECILLNVVGKIYTGIFVVTEGLIDDEQGDFRSGVGGLVDQIFTLNRLGCVCVLRI